MEAKELIEEIERLPVQERIWLIERTLKTIRTNEIKDKIEAAVKELYSDYKTDKELTAFTDLDFEEFYETR
ncbi:MAG: hypothetical protein ISS16_04870 [Ignavibacteria bacterium]|nr:hypothetical protein [Ignavibacteria bacterium]